MKTPNRCRLAVAVVAICCSCSPTSTVGSRFVKSQMVQASVGAVISVASSDSKELAGARLVIDPGALASDTTIQIEVGTMPLTDATDKGAGPVAIWGPAGTKFSKPAHMVLPYVLPTGDSPDRIFVQVKEQDGTRFVIDHTVLNLDTAANTVAFDVHGFTGFQPGTNTPCMANNDCAQGQACINGVCKSAGCSSSPN